MPLFLPDTVGGAGGEGVLSLYTTDDLGAPVLTAYNRLELPTPLSATQGWMALRGKPLTASSTYSSGNPNSTGNLHYFVWATDATHYIVLGMNQQSKQLYGQRNNGGVAEQVLLPGCSWNAGDDITAVICWTPTVLRVAFAAPGVSLSAEAAASVQIPDLSSTTFCDAGTGGDIRAGRFDGGLWWAAHGHDILELTDMTAIVNAPSEASPTGYLPAPADVCWPLWGTARGALQAQ